MGDYIDELNETYEDSYESPDKDEVMPELQQEETSEEPVRAVLSVPKVWISKYRDRKELDEIMFKNDTLRKKYDLRNVDESKINNIFMRAHIKQLKERSKLSSN